MKWQIPGAFAAIDGKHVGFKAPPNSGSRWYCYKGIHSMVLLAMCDFEYKFIAIDVGAYGSCNDSSVFRKSRFGRELASGSFPIPPPVTLSQQRPRVPCYILGDAAFPMSCNLMRPFTGKGLPEKEEIFNYRLSRGRRVIENAFGILVQKWQIFKRTINLSPSVLELVIKTCCALHNFVRHHEGTFSSHCFEPGSIVDMDGEDGSVTPGSWREQGLGELQPLEISVGRYPADARRMRDVLCSYFLAEGAVPWQWRSVGRPDPAASVDPDQ